MAKVIYPICQRPVYLEEKRWEPGSMSNMIRLGKGSFALRSTGAHYANTEEMSERSTDRRNVPITLPKLKYMD